jgi:hypothetical protein
VAARLARGLRLTTISSQAAYLAASWWGKLRLKRDITICTFKLLSEKRVPAFHYDTDHTTQAVDVEIKISKTGSGLDPS